jgi:hypothetical protein
MTSLYFNCYIKDNILNILLQNQQFRKKNGLAVIGKTIDKKYSE